MCCLLVDTSMFAALWLSVRCQELINTFRLRNSCAYLLRHQALASPPHHRLDRLPRRIYLRQCHQQRRNPRVATSPLHLSRVILRKAFTILTKRDSTAVGARLLDPVGLALTLVLTQAVAITERGRRCLRPLAAPRPSGHVSSKKQ